MPARAMDLPASDEPAGAYPLPLEDAAPLLAESAALPAGAEASPVPAEPAPVFTPSGYRSSGTISYKNETS